MVGMIRNIIACSFFSALLMLVACSDFHGPWEYYPEKRNIYTGIFTYGTIVADENPEICFSKIYELDETSSKDFAFYDSAYVTVKGCFKRTTNDEDADTTIVLRPYSDKPNCFSSDYMGVVGKSYTMDAYFEWDSSGHKAKSRYTAEATIPTPVRIKGLNVPCKMGTTSGLLTTKRILNLELSFWNFRWIWNLSSARWILIAK
jgi:hypothetical protein